MSNDYRHQILLTGQIRGGKNNLIVTRTGMRFPRPEWKRWKDNAVAQVIPQFRGQEALSLPCRATIRYWAGDRKRRDIPAVLDAIFHVLEHAGVLVDDALVKEVDFVGRYDKANPRAEIELTASEYQD